MALNPTDQHKGAIIRPARNAANKYDSEDPLGLASAGGAPSAIADLTRGSMGSTGTSLSWTLPADTDNVKVYEENVTDGVAFDLRETVGAVESYNVTGLDPEKQYRWKVVASNADGDSGDSNVVSGTTGAVTGDSGGTSALSWNAPNGLSDGNTITLTTDGTYTLTPPDKFVWLGFGRGWLYDNALGTEFQDVTVGTEVLDYNITDAQTTRKIAEVGGIRYLEATVKPDGVSQTAGNAAAGFINWDTGSEITNSDSIFMSSLSSCDQGNVAGASFQWKQPRINHDGSLVSPNRNMLYYTHTGPTGSGARFLGRPGTGDDRAGYFSGPKNNGSLTYHGFVWVPNDPGSNNGYVAAHAVDSLDGYRFEDAPTDSGGSILTDFIDNTIPERPQFAVFQDYIGNDADGTRDITIRRTDIYMKRGGVLFLLGDASTPATCEHLVPLVPNSTGNNEWTCYLWKQRMADYSGKYVHLFDDRLNILASVAL